MYNETLGEVFIEKPGFYISSLSLAVPLQSSANFFHFGIFHDDQVCSNGSIANGILSSSGLSIDEVKQFDLPLNVIIETRQNDTITYSDRSSKATSWAMFKYNTNDVFYGGFTGLSSEGKMIFGDVKVYNGIAFSIDKLRITQSGVYFISLTISIASNTPYEFLLQVNDRNLPFNTGRLIWQDSKLFSPHTISRSWLLQLKNSDEISVKQVNSNSVNLQGTNSFALFKLDSNVERPAITGVRTMGWQNPNGDVDLNPMEFDRILLQIGNYWNVRDNVYEIYTSGFYFLTLTGGCTANRRLHIQILVNGLTVGELINHNTVFSGSYSVSRTMILNLQRNDVLQFTAIGNSAIDANFSMTTFTLFFIK